MSLLSISCVTVNAHDPWALARFWAECLGGEPTEAGNGFVLLRSGPEQTTLLFQASSDPRPERSWIHFDCEGGQVDDLMAAGASVVERRSDSKGSWVVMADPEGNLFCIGG